MYASMSKLYRK